MTTVAEVGGKQMQRREPSQRFAWEQRVMTGEGGAEAVLSSGLIAWRASQLVREEMEVDAARVTQHTAVS